MSKKSEAMLSIKELNAMLADEARKEQELLAKAPKPVLSSPAEKPQVPPLRKLPTLRRRAVDLSSSPGSAPAAKLACGPVGLPDLPEGDGLLLNHEAHLLLIANLLGRFTASQGTEYLAYIKKEGPYGRKPVSMEVYRENSVRRRLAKLVKAGYLKRLPRTSQNSVCFVVTPLGQMASTLRGNLQTDILAADFDIHSLDIVRHNAILSLGTAIIRVLTGQFGVEIYDRSQQSYRSLTVKGGLNIVPGVQIYDAAKDVVTRNPEALQREAQARLVIETSAPNRSGLSPYPSVTGMLPLNGSHSDAVKGLINKYLNRGVATAIDGEEHDAIPPAYIWAPLSHTGKGVELVPVVHFGIALPNIRQGNVYSSGSAVAHVGGTSSYSEEDRQATLFHLMAMVITHPYVFICSDVTQYEKTKQEYTNSLRRLIEAGLLPKGCRDRLGFISYELINSKGVVDPYVNTNDRYALTPSMG